MLKTKINGVEFEAREYVPFDYADGLRIILFVYTDSIDAVVEAAGNKANIEIEGLFVGTDFKLERAIKYWDNGREACEIHFAPFDIANNVQANTDDIEIMAGAIEELAEIIG